MNRRKWFYILYSAVLSNHVPGPVFLRRILASWRLAHPLCGRDLLYRNCIKLDGHSVFKSGVPRWHFRKQKKDHDIIQPITGNVPCGRSNRNPSNIINVLAFLNDRMQCNIRGGESQCSVGSGKRNLQYVHFRYTKETGLGYTSQHCSSLLPDSRRPYLTRYVLKLIVFSERVRYSIYILRLLRWSENPGRSIAVPTGVLYIGYRYNHFFAAVLASNLASIARGDW